MNRAKLFFGRLVPSSSGMKNKKAKGGNDDGFHQTEIELATSTTDPEGNREGTSEVDSEISAKYPDSGWRAYLVVLGSFLGLTVDYGFMNAIGVVQMYLDTHQLSNVPTRSSSMIFAVCLLLGYVLCVVGGVMFDELGPRIPLIIGTVLIFIGLFLTGSCTSVSSFIGMLGVVTGLGFGLCGGPLAGVISHWFYKNRSKAFALATLGDSVGGIIFPIILNSLFAKVGFTWALRIFSFICLTLMTMSILLVRGRKSELFPKKKNELKRDTSTPIMILRKIIKLCQQTVDFRALKDRTYFWCTLGVSFSDLGLVCVATYFPSFVTHLGFSDTTASISITVINAVGILGRYLPGILADHIGPFNVMIMMMVATAICIWVLWLAWSFSSASIASVYTFAVFYGFFNSAVLSLAPSCIGSIVPTEKFGKAYGTTYLITGIFIFGGTIGGGSIIGEGSSTNFKWFIIYCGLLYTASSICYLFEHYCQVGFKIRTKI